MIINLTKSCRHVDLKKSSAILVRVMWSSATDYDLGAEVVYLDGHTESIAAFGAGKRRDHTYRTPPKMQTTDGKIRHLGDAKRGDGTMAQEIIEVELTDDIVAVVPWVYSAQSNGTGSFYRHAVSLEVTDGDKTVRIDSVNASNDDLIYACIPGSITNIFGKGPEVRYLELYSGRRSENRPKASWGEAPWGRGGHVVIDTDGGHKNEFKR